MIITKDTAVAVSSKIEMTDAAGEKNVASSSRSNNREKNIELMDYLYSAAADGNIKKFEQHARVLKQILTPNEPLWMAHKRGETLLHMAARHGHADVAKFHLEECKKPKQNNHDQELGIKNTRKMLQMINEAKDTALHEAVHYNHIDVVKVLTAADCELLYDANTAGETPLYLAAERGYEEVLDEIFHTCFSPADHGRYSRTALHAHN
ncbi:hypothetical protein Dsin_020526 [Dipteronia sinensis]|uniref:Uncharacterized protein n=1 Tax=Dipteronia sinensis TaxID=43782 RepID=A0AAE0A9M4_9ROSI|nr:hypothetical protein Dsin_020526 [Dipteronia sinensis]